MPSSAVNAQKEQESQPVDVSELDEFDIDAGDALEAEIAAELKQKSNSHRRSQKVERLVAVMDDSLHWNAFEDKFGAFLKHLLSSRHEYR